MPGLSQSEFQLLLSKIDRIPQLRGIAVAFVGRGRCQVVRKSPMPEGLQTWIVIHEEEISQPTEPTPQKSSSTVVSDLLQVGFSCTSAVLAGTASVGSAAAAPITGGTSLALTIVLWSGATATAASCGIGIGRLWNDFLNPGNNELLDSEAWYQKIILALDVISVAGSIGTLSQTAKAALRMSRTSGRPLIIQILKGMNRAERKNLAQDIARYMGKATTRRQIIRLARQGKIAKIFTRHQVREAVVKQLIYSASAVLSLIDSSRAGAINQWVIHIVADAPK